MLGTAGNVSARHGEEVAITPTGAVLAELEAEQVSVVDLDGRQVGGELAPTSEIDLHLGVYRRYDAGAVVHTHAPVATALSCVLEDELPCVHYQMLLLGGTVPVARYATFGTPELATSVLDALEGSSAALMANHGAIVHAQDLDGALELSLLWNGRAPSTGVPRRSASRACSATRSARRWLPPRSHATTAPRIRLATTHDGRDDRALVVLVDAEGAETVPAFEVEAVDTTGCGDAFSAGFLRGLALGRERRDAAVLGCAAAALVAQGLGTDHGDFELAAVEQMAARVVR